MALLVDAIGIGTDHSRGRGRRSAIGFGERGPKPCPSKGSIRCSLVGEVVAQLQALQVSEHFGMFICVVGSLLGVGGEIVQFKHGSGPRSQLLAVCVA